MLMPELMPNWKEIEFKQDFIDKYKKLTDFNIFKKYSLSFLRRSIRVNNLKISTKKLRKKIKQKGWITKQIPWCKQGFWVEHKKGRRDIGNLSEHALGYFFVQEAASMIPPIALNPRFKEKILDMAAAPGSKATQIAQYMGNKGILIANDYKKIRTDPLKENIQRMGITNTIVTIKNARKIKGFEFDKILLDAPCSGTGAIRKSIKTLKMWNPNEISRLAGTQKQLIKTAFKNLKSGGTLVYSTCSLEPEENEEVIDYLLEEESDAQLEKTSLPGLKTSNPITKFNKKTYNPEIKKTLRIWPQDNDTEGFFVAKIKKE